MADMDESSPGFVDEESGAVTIDAEGDASNYGIVDEIARRVLAHGGRVLAAAPRRHPRRRHRGGDPALPRLADR